MHKECNVDNMNFGIDNNKNMNNNVEKNIENLGNIFNLYYIF